MLGKTNVFGHNPDDWAGDILAPLFFNYFNLHKNLTVIASSPRIHFSFMILNLQFIEFADEHVDFELH